MYPSRSTRLALTVSAAGLTAAAATSLAGPSPAAAGTASAPAPAHAHHQRFAMTFVSAQGEDLPIRVVASGPIHGRGTMVQRPIKETANGGVLAVTITLTDGKVRLRVKDHESMKLNRRSCTARERGKGTWRIVSGTGAYRKASGHGSFVRSAYVVGAFDRSGHCLGQSAPPQASGGTVVADGVAASGRQALRQ